MPEIPYRDVIAILEATPGKLRREVASMTPLQIKARPASGKWSVQQILAHLDDVEYLGMRQRVEAMVVQDKPTLEPFDQEKRAKDFHYERIPYRKSLEHFIRQRRANVRWLKTLAPAQLKRSGNHRKIGRITVNELIYEWAFHDLGHLKQILEVKRYALWPRMGSFQKYYKLT